MARVGGGMLRCEAYRRLERQLDANVRLGSERIGTLADLLAKDLSADDNAPYVLSIFRKLFAKIETEDITDYSFLLKTIGIVIEKFTAAIENGEAALAERYLEVLSSVPTHVYRVSDDRSFDLVIVAIKACSRCEWNTVSENAVVSFFKTFIGSLPEEERKRFAVRSTQALLSTVIPCMFTKGGKNRNFTLMICNEIVAHILETDYFHHNEWKVVFENIKDKNKYPNVMLAMFNSSDPLWCDLFVFIIKILGVQLHKIGGSINNLLYILQEALKRNVDIKCQAFTCLKALMDNYALDPKIFEHSNRVKIFSTVFESNNAKTEKISLLKFRIWWHFISLIQDSIKLHYKTILIPFLTYCFGDPKKDGTNQIEVNKVYPGLVFPSIKKLSVKTFVEICGHRNCSDCTKNSVIQLKGPFLDSNLLGENHIKLIHALKQVTNFVCAQLPNTDKEIYEELRQNLKCIWTSFIQVSTMIKRTEFAVVMKSIFQLLSSFVEITETNEKLSDVITTIIIPTVVDKQFGYSIAALNDKTIEIMDKFTPLQYLVQLVSKMYHKVTNLKSHSSFKIVINVGLCGDMKGFTDWFLNRVSSYNHASLLWCSLEESLSLSYKQIPADVILSTLLWPIDNYKCDEKVILVMNSWGTLFNIKKSKICNVKEQSMIQSEEEILSSILNATKRDNYNVLCLFFFAAYMKKQAEDKLGQVVTFEKSLTGSRVILDTIENKYLTSLESVTLCHSLQSLEKLLSICHTYHIETSSLTDLMSVTNHSLRILATYYKNNSNIFVEAGLESSIYFDTFLDSLNRLLSTKYSEYLICAIVELIHYIKENIPYFTIKEKASQILTCFLDGESNMLEESELIKIQLLRNKYDSKNKDFSMDSKKVNNCSEKSIASDENGIKKAPLKKQKLDDGFIIIKPTWKFDPRNLTDHQKDSLKRRRDDIPALYEDLSQSQDENSIKAWKPPGYHSDSQESSSTTKNMITNSNIENQNNTECEKKITERVTQMLNSCNENISEVLIFKSNLSVNKKSVDSFRKPSDQVAQMINQCLTDNNTKSEISNNTVNENANGDKIVNEDNNNVNLSNSPFKNCVDDMLSNKDEVVLKGFDISSKENIENNFIISSHSRKIDTSTNFKREKNKSILSKLNDDIKNLKNNNKDAFAFDSNVYSKNNSVKLEQNVRTVNVVLENNVIKNLNDHVNNVDKSMKKDETDVSIDFKSQSTQETNIGTNFSIRPSRTKRKPSKLLTNMSNEKNKNSKIKSKINEKLPPRGNKVNGQSTKSSANEKDFVMEISALSQTNKKTSRLINQLNIDTIEGHPLLASNKNEKSVKCSRLINQLSIDTIEGHPLLASNKNEKSVKCTRRSLHNYKNSQDNNKTVYNAKIQKRKSCSDVKKASPTDDLINKDNSNKLNKDRSIFSQETEVRETEHILCYPADNVSLKAANQVAVLSSDLSLINSQGKDVNFDYSPDFIESSQEDSLSHKTLALKNNSVHMEQTMSEPLTLKQLSTNCIENSTADVKINDVEMSNTQMNDADAEPVSHSMCDADTLPLTGVPSDEILGCNVTQCPEVQEKCDPDIVINYDSFVDGKDNNTTCVSDMGDSSRAQNLLNNTSIVSSPCKDDTSERLMEFLNNTMDISPIKSISLLPENSHIDNVSPKPDMPREDIKTPVDRASTHKTTVISPDLFCSEKTDQCPKTSPPKSASICESSNWSLMKNFPSRSVQMLSLCMTNDSIINAKQNETTDVKHLEHFNDDDKNNEPLLEFSKTVPSITASPIGPILKRKLEPDELATSPSSKKKRVSFHDPPVSTSVNVEKYIIPKSPLIKIPCKTDQNVNKLFRQSSAKCLMEKLEVYSEPNHLNSIQTVDNKENRISFATDSQLSDICSLSVDSPQPISIVKNHLLDDANPIYPSLINCSNSLAEISACLSSPLWNNEFLDEVRDRVVTIGDLAKLSELEVNRLPIKAPKIETVKKVLTEYENNFNKHNKEKESIEYSIIEKSNNMLKISNTNLDNNESALLYKPLSEIGSEERICTRLESENMKSDLLAVESSQNSKTLEATLPNDEVLIVNMDDTNNSLRLSVVGPSTNILEKVVENHFQLSEKCLLDLKVGNIPLDDYLCNCVESGDIKSIIPKTFKKIMTMTYSQIRDPIESNLISLREKILSDITKSLDILNEPKC